MKIVFISCVELGLKPLEQIIRDGWEIGAIFTLAKKYARNTSGYVDLAPVARKQGIKIYKVKNINASEHVVKIKKIEPDVIIVCGWQRLIGEDILKIPPLGTIGFHSSLLPRYRGRAPVNWAIINGEKKTGLTMFFCDTYIDTGDIIAQKSFRIKINDNCGMVYEKSANAAAQLLHEKLPCISNRTVKTYKNTSSKHKLWPKRSPGDGNVNWRMDVVKIHNWIRALSHPYPGAFSYLDKKQVKIWEAKIIRMQREYPKAKRGQIVKMFKNGTFVVKCRGGYLLVNKYSKNAKVCVGFSFSCSQNDIKA